MQFVLRNFTDRFFFKIMLEGLCSFALITTTFLSACVETLVFKTASYSDSQQAQVFEAQEGEYTSVEKLYNYRKWMTKIEQLFKPSWTSLLLPYNKEITKT